MTAIGSFIIPIVICVIVIFGFVKKVAVFDSFATGAKDGISVCISILPTLIGLIVAIGMFKSSGALDMLTRLLEPIFEFLGFPSELLPLILLRPFSGSGSLALCNSIFQSYGVDSYIGRLAAVMMGSTETMFYVIAIYFGSFGIKKTRYTIISAILADIVGYIVAFISVGLFFIG